MYLEPSRVWVPGSAFSLPVPGTRKGRPCPSSRKMGPQEVTCRRRWMDGFSRVSIDEGSCKVCHLGYQRGLVGDGRGVNEGS